MSVRRSVAWAFLGQGFCAAVGFGSSVVIARLLTPYEFGINAVAVATSGILSVIAASGADALIVREVSLTKQALATATTVNAILFTSFSAVLMGVSFIAGPLLGDANVGAVIRILAILPLLNILTFRPAAMLQRAMRFKVAALVASAAVVVNNAVTITAILLGASYVGPAIGAVSGVAVTVLLYLLIIPAELRLSFSSRKIGATMAFGLRMISVSGAGQFVQHASQIVLSRMLGIAALGLYSRAALLVNFLFSQIYGTATRVAFAQLSRVHRETGEVKEAFLSSFYMITTVMWPLLLSLAVIARPAIVILYGENWIEAATPLSILLIAQVLALGFGMNWELFVIKDRLAVQARYEITRLSIGLIAFAGGCLVSMTAAALGRLVDVILGCILYFPWLSRLSGAQSSEIVAIYARSGAIAFVTAVPPFALMAATGWDANVSRPLLLASLVAGGVSWGVMLWLFSHPLLGEAGVLIAASRRTFASLPFASLRRVGDPDAAAAPQAGERTPLDERF